MTTEMKDVICRDLQLDYANYRVGDSFRVPFYCYIGTGKHAMRTVSCQFGHGSATIDDILAKLTVLDKPREMLPRFIRDDYGLGFGVDVPQYGVFSVEAKFPEMFPIVSYRLNESGVLKYFAHPQINLMIQRYR